MLLRPQRHVCLLGTYQEIPFEYKGPVIGLREPYDPHARSASLVKPEVRYILVDPQIRRTDGVWWRFVTMGADVRGKIYTATSVLSRRMQPPPKLVNRRVVTSPTRTADASWTSLVSP